MAPPRCPCHIRRRKAQRSQNQLRRRYRVEDLYSRDRSSCKCRNMASSQVADVNVVACAGCRQGVVVVAKDMNSLAHQWRVLSHVRNEVIRECLWIFSDKSGLVCANRVEVANRTTFMGSAVCVVAARSSILPAVWVGSRLLGLSSGQGQRVRDRHRRVCRARRR